MHWVYEELSWSTPHVLTSQPIKQLRKINNSETLGHQVVEMRKNVKGKEEGHKSP
jgi:hypothetical protein